MENSIGKWKIEDPVLFRFLVLRVLAAKPAVLVPLELVRILRLVLRQGVVPPLASGTLEMNDGSHEFLSLCPYVRMSVCPYVRTSLCPDIRT